MKRRRNRQATPQRRHSYVELLQTHNQGMNVRRELRNRWTPGALSPEEQAAFTQLKSIYNPEVL